MGSKRSMPSANSISSSSQRLRGSVSARTRAITPKPPRTTAEILARAVVDSATSGRYGVCVPSIGVFEALSLVRRTYRAAPPATRVHVFGRFLTCPFLRVLDHLPPGARVLDIGAGHGIFSHLALKGGARSVVAVEPDLRKVFAIARRPNLRVVGGYDSVVAGHFEAVTLFDVLYRFPLGDWDALFRAIRERLAPGGILLIKELDPEHRVKAFWNRTQERISDRIGLTLGEAFSYETRGQLRERLLAAGFTSFKAVEIGAGYPHAHILYVTGADQST
ncbi:MAG TPA: class I SAM-dependent methyltransferase [Thermoanaerobaculia bacterium]|nr:class I SAM-dependent methyltransferase [Thermoanaerobaculia bacterium]